MANVLLEYGPYNSKADSKREYEARDIGRMFDGIVTDGVFPYIGERFNITKDTSGALKIKVGTGRAWFNHTWNYLDSPMTFKLENGHYSYKRYDTVVLQIGCSELVRENLIYIKKGTASADPKPPTLSIDEEALYEYAIGYIEVPANANDIQASNITYLVGRDSDPKGFYLPGQFAEFAYAIGDNHLGKKIVTVSNTPSAWQSKQSTGADHTEYFYREIDISGITNDAIFNYDLWVNGTDILSIQKQENAFSYLFRLEVLNNKLCLYSYYKPNVAYTIRFIGKGVNNVN